jgi:hypothetical protein
MLALATPTALPGDRCDEPRRPVLKVLLPRRLPSSMTHFDPKRKWRQLLDRRLRPILAVSRYPWDCVDRGRPGYNFSNVGPRGGVTWRGFGFALL